MILTGVVAVPPAVAAELAPLVRAAMRRAVHEDKATFTAAAWSIADDLDVVARTLRSHVVADVVAQTPGRLSPAIVDSCMEVVGTAEAARRLGITKQAVLRRIARGTLPSRRDGRGRHWIATENLPEAT